jgi:autotransporter passenger strand-loop-strand repeat protein
MAAPRAARCWNSPRRTARNLFLFGAAAWTAAEVVVGFFVSNVIVSSGQTEVVSSGQTDIENSILSGGFMQVLSGGTATDTGIDGGAFKKYFAAA